MSRRRASRRDVAPRDMFRRRRRRRDERMACRRSDAPGLRPRGGERREAEAQPRDSRVVPRRPGAGGRAARRVVGLARQARRVVLDGLGLQWALRGCCFVRRVFNRGGVAATPRARRGYAEGGRRSTVERRAYWMAWARGLRGELAGWRGPWMAWARGLRGELTGWRGPAVFAGRIAATPRGARRGYSAETDRGAMDSRLG